MALGRQMDHPVDRIRPEDLLHLFIAANIFFYERIIRRIFDIPQVFQVARIG